MMNRSEDFATVVERFYEGSDFRTTVRDEIYTSAGIGKGKRIDNPELAIKYLFVKYMTSFAGKE